MAFQITGKLEFIGEVITRPSKNGGQPFQSRDFVLDATRYNPDTGEPWENHPRFELGARNLNILDGFQIGQRVTVDFSLRGAKYTDQQTGEMKYFTSISAFRVVNAEQPSGQGTQSPNQPSTAQPAPATDDADDPNKLPF